jgi:epoxyqueuosine reductase
MGDWLFGCDVCQEVCPWNSRKESSHEPGLGGEQAFEPCPDNNPVDLVSLFEMDDNAFRRRFRHTPLWRAKRRGILRNAAILLGNRPTPAAATALVRGLNDSESLVRAAAAWALGNYHDATSASELERRRVVENDAEVRREIDDALARRR